MRNLIIIALTVFSITSCSQKTESIEGEWLKENYPEKGLIFNSDNTFELYNGNDPDTKQLKMDITYETVIKDNSNYLIYNYYDGEKLIGTEELKYKIEDGKLYLPVKSADLKTGKTVNEEFSDIYVKAYD